MISLRALAFLFLLQVSILTLLKLHFGAHRAEESSQGVGQREGSSQGSILTLLKLHSGAHRAEESSQGVGQREGSSQGVGQREESSQGISQREESPQGISQRVSGVDQYDAELLYFWEMIRDAPEATKFDFQKQLGEVIAYRIHVDSSFKLIGQLLFGIEKGPEVLKARQVSAKPIVDDWTCFKSMVRTFETYCGSLSLNPYGLKHMGAIDNICNEGVTREQMAKVCALACPSFPSNPWSSIQRGFSL